MRLTRRAAVRTSAAKSTEYQQHPIETQGPKPLSEPETQAIPAFLRLLPFPPTLALSLHAFGRSVLHPFSCQSLASTLNSTMLHLFKHGTRSILSNIPHKYTTGQAWEIPGLYSVNGDAADYLFHAHSILSFNVELPPDYPPKNEYLSFWPPRQDHVQEANLLLWNALKLSGCDLVIENNQNQRYEKPKSKMNLREDEKHENENRNRHDNALVFRITVFISRFVFTIERGLSCLFESPSSMGFRIVPMESSLASRFDRASVSSSVQSSILFAGF